MCPLISVNFTACHPSIDICAVAFYGLHNTSIAAEKFVNSAIMQISNCIYPGIDKTVLCTFSFAVTDHGVVDCRLCSQRLDRS